MQAARRARVQQSGWLRDGRSIGEAGGVAETEVATGIECPVETDLKGPQRTAEAQTDRLVEADLEEQESAIGLVEQIEHGDQEN